MDVNIYLLLSMVSLGTSTLVSTEGTCVTDVPEQGGERNGYRGSCKCQGNMCWCCGKIKIDKIKLNDSVCVNVSYLPSELGVEVSMSIDGKVLIKTKVSLKDPPPICIYIPYLKKLAKACIGFSSLNVSDKEFFGCIDFTAKLMGWLLYVTEVRIGCLTIPVPLSDPLHHLVIPDDIGTKFSEMGTQLKKNILLKKLKIMEDILNQTTVKIRNSFSHYKSLFLK